MVKYYFFPQHYDLQLKTSIESWLQDIDRYVTVTGVYQAALDTEVGDSIVYNFDILKQKTFIKKGFIDNYGNAFTLKGYCLEADLFLLAPDYQNVINNIPDILQFDNLETYLVWQANLNLKQ